MGEWESGRVGCCTFIQPLGSGPGNKQTERQAYRQREHHLLVLRRQCVIWCGCCMCVCVFAKSKEYRHFHLDQETDSRERAPSACGGVHFHLDKETERATALEDSISSPCIGRNSLHQGHTIQSVYTRPYKETGCGMDLTRKRAPFLFRIACRVARVLLNLLQLGRVCTETDCVHQQQLQLLQVGCQRQAHQAYHRLVIVRGTLGIQQHDRVLDSLRCRLQENPLHRCRCHLLQRNYHQHLLVRCCLCGCAQGRGRRHR